MAKTKAKAKTRRKRKPVRRTAHAKPKRRRTRHTPVKRRKRRVGARKRTPAKRRKRSPGRKLVKQVERRSVERVMAGKRPRKRRAKRRRVRMAGPVSRRRTVGQSGGSGMMLGLLIGAGALYLLTRNTGSTQTYSNLPAVATTGNVTRDTQSQQIVNYAIAAGVAVNAIAALINSLNSSSDSTVSNIYDKVNTTGQLTDLGIPGYDAIV